GEGGSWSGDYGESRASFLLRGPIADPEKPRRLKERKSRRCYPKRTATTCELRFTLEGRLRPGRLQKRASTGSCIPTWQPKPTSKPSQRTASASCQPRPLWSGFWTSVAKLAKTRFKLALSG